MKISKVFRKDLNQFRWRLDLTLDGVRVRRSDFKTRREAEDTAAALIARARDRRFGIALPDESATLGELIEQSAPTNRNVKLALSRFVAIHGEEISLTTLRRSHLREYRDTLQALGLKNSTINSYVQHVCALLNRAGNYWPDLDWNPPKLKQLPVGPGRDRVLSAEEISRLCKAFVADRLPGERIDAAKSRLHIFDAFRVALLTGAREGEVLNLSEQGINREWQTIKIYRQKTKTTSVLPLTPLLAAILEMRPKDAEGRFFADLTLNKLVYGLRRIGPIAGVPYGDRVENGWVFHSLRHTAATVMQLSGADEASAAAVLGHKRAGQTAQYTHASLESKRRAMMLLEEWCKKIPTLTAGLLLGLKPDDGILPGSAAPGGAQRHMR